MISGRLSGWKFRSAALATALLCALPAGVPRSVGQGNQTTTAGFARSLLTRAAWSMIAHHIRGPRTGKGWAWPSAIQSPEVNSDRDVGAASVGMGFIAAYQTTGNRAFLHAAQEAADWLVSIAEPGRGGLHWPNSESATAIDHTSYTSFDDGAMGIADFLYRVYALDHARNYLRVAEAGLRWEESVGFGADGHRCPARCSWRWDRNPRSGVFTGMGMGVSGIAYGFDLFARRTGSAQYERYAIGAANYIQRLIDARGAVPEQPGQPGWDTGYLSGSAGDAFMFLSLYHHTHSARWLRDATRLLGFVDSSGHRSGHQEWWPIEIDPSGRQNNNAAALGIEEGNAGIGWVMLNAFELTRRAAYLEVAIRAGNYLVAHLSKLRDGLACAEDLRGGNNRLFHTSLDNGAAGCGSFLVDLSIVTGIRKYRKAADRLAVWLKAVSRTGPRGIWWHDQLNVTSGRWINAREMSWHWGQAGIVAFLSRLSGWRISMPTEQQSIVPLARATPRESKDRKALAAHDRSAARSPRRARWACLQVIAETADFFLELRDLRAQRADLVGPGNTARVEPVDERVYPEHRSQGREQTQREPDKGRILGRSYFDYPEVGPS